MATFYIKVTDNGDGTWTPLVQHTPTQHASGTALSLSAYVNDTGSFGITSKHLKAVLQAAQRTILNHAASAGW